MGLSDPRDSSILRSAFQWFGLPNDAVEVVGENRPLTEWKGPYHNELSSLLSILAFPVYVAGSGRGAVFVPEMDLQAFPLIAPESGWLRLARCGMRRLLGLHHTH